MSRIGTSRPSVERIVYMAETLRSGKPLILGEVANRFEVSKKTVERDLTFLRDRFRYVIAFKSPGQVLGSHFSWHLISAPEPRL